MFKEVDRAMNKTRTAIQLAATLLIGFMMVFAVGLPLVAGGVGSGLVPLVLGCCAFWTARKHFRVLTS